MKTLHVNIANKKAVYCRRGGDIVCGNSNYQIKFTFDAEWDAFSTKTARFVSNGEFTDVDFTGDTVAVPIMHNTEVLKVGVYAGDLRTTSPALIPCLRSILCLTDSPSADNDKHYANEAKEAAERAESAANNAVAEFAELSASQMLGGIVQNTGESESQVMSQKATTGAIDELSTTQKKYVFGGDFTGSVYKKIPCNIPAGTYDLHIDSFGSNDTNGTQSQIRFMSGDTELKAFNVDRYIAIDKMLTFSASVDSIHVYASTTYNNSVGDTYDIRGLTITADTVLNKRITDLEKAADELEEAQSAVKDSIAALTNGIFAERVDPEWSLGGLQSADGSTNTLNTRIRTDFMPMSNLVISVGADVVCRVYFYKESGLVYISASDTFTNAVAFIQALSPADATCFRLLLYYPDGRTITDIAALAGTVQVKGMPTNSNGGTEEPNELALAFTYGTLQSANGEYAGNNKRIYTPTALPLQEVYLTVDEGCKYTVYFYDEQGRYLSFPGWITTPTMLMSIAPDNAASAKFVMAYADDRLIANSAAETAKIQACAAYFHCHTATSAEYIANLRPSLMAELENVEYVEPEYRADVPENIGVLNAILNFKQLTEIKYTPKATIPHTASNYFTPGTQRTGIPYSSTRPESLFVPTNVSLHTFMTAMQNPNSYLYTVDLSAVGNQNGNTYYGAVCSTACGYALGIEPNYSTHQWADIPGMEVIENQSAYGLKLCDTIVGSGHVVMVTDITRNKRGKIGHITISEAINPVCKSTNYTPEELEAAYPPSTYKYCRYKKLYAVKHEQSPYVAVEDETPQTATYNTEIIPRKGDKANWLKGVPVEIDVLKIGNYGSIQVYKDGEWLLSKPIASLITLADLEPGSYKARLSDGTNYSSYCYWMVVDAVSTATPTGSEGKVNVTFSASNATPVWVQWCNGSHNGTVHINPLTSEEAANGSTICTGEPGSYKVRVAFKTEYGIIHSELPEAITVK